MIHSLRWWHKIFLLFCGRFISNRWVGVFVFGGIAGAKLLA